jgi:hypothetical protein
MMIEDKIFRNAVAISILFHFCLFYNWPPLKKFPFLKPQEQVVLTYFSPAKVPIPSRLVADKPIKGSGLNMSVTANRDKEPINGRDFSKPTYTLKDSEKMQIRTEEIKDDKPIRHIPSSDKMLISHEDKDLSKEPTYLSYYNAVRASIYKTANTNKPHYVMGGEVKLTFSIARDGSLINVAVIDNASTPNAILRNHAVKSIKDASPFPPFTASMKEGRLTLRLAISFEK